MAGPQVRIGLRGGRRGAHGGQDSRPPARLAEDAAEHRATARSRPPRTPTDASATRRAREGPGSGALEPPRRGAGAGCRWPRPPVSRPRPGPCPRPRAARPRRSRPPRPRRPPPRASAASAGGAPVVRPDHEHELATGGDPAVRRGRRQLAERAAHDLLVQLGQLAAHGPGPLRAAGRGQVPERGRDPSGRLEQRRSPRSSAAIRASRSRRSRPDRGRNPSNAQRGPATPEPATAASTADAPGDRHDRAALPGPGRHELAARVADGRRPGVGDERQVGAARRCASSASARAGPLRAW